MDIILFDIIIATYNRAEKVNLLVMSLMNCNQNYNQIIVVDSSDETNQFLMNVEGVLYIQTQHKNQPFQRYLGYMASKGEILLFLDDDMEIADSKFKQKLEYIFKDQTITGIAIQFKNKHDDSSLTHIPSSKIFKKAGLINIIKGYITGYPQLADGKFGLCGNRGKMPVGGGITEWVSGGAFAAKRLFMFRNFNFQLFDIFEERIGMGEDGIIGYSLSKQGKVIYHDELFFIHNDQKDSTYSMNTYDFAKKVAFSRLFLSLEKKRLDNGSLIIARLHYHYYMFWRIIGLLTNFLLMPSNNLRKSLKGSMMGWKIGLGFKFSHLVNKREFFWKNEASNNLVQNRQTPSNTLK